MKAILLATTLLLTANFAHAGDISQVQPVAFQMTVKGKTVVKLLALLDKVGVKSTKSKSYDIRHIKVRGEEDRTDEGKPLGTSTFDEITGIDHQGDYSGRQELNLDMSKPEAQQLGELLITIGGSRVMDYAMHGQFGFNVPWISCYGGKDLGGPSCQVTVATDLDIDVD